MELSEIMDELKFLGTDVKRMLQQNIFKMQLIKEN